MSFPRRFTPLLLFLSSILSASASEGDPNLKDPSVHVRSVLLPNGLKVVTSPSEQAKTVQLKVVVRAGHFNEENGKAGVAHLLEHYLFTDAKMDPGMTYIDAIKEKGGSGNATTTTTATSYFATVPPRLAPWLVKIFGKILFQKKFVEKTVQLAKKPVYLEIGQPQPFDFLLNLMHRMTPDFAHFPDFWETEFGVRYPKYNHVAARFDTQGLAAEDLKNFYDHYYHPENMTLFIAGNFSEREIMPLIEAAFGVEPERMGGGWIDPQPVARIGNYTRSDVTDGTPSIRIGTKVTHLSLQDEVAVKVYLHYLSHRLMKDLRNKRGETYSVRTVENLYHGSGEFGLQFEAPPEKYAENLAFVQDMIDRETRKGQITDEMFKEATDLYGKLFQLSDRDSSTMMWLAERSNTWDEVYPNRPDHMTEYAAFRRLTPAVFTESLTRNFRPDMKIQSLSEPPIFFRLESTILMIFGCAFWMRIGRRLLARNFDHSQVRWLRKINFPPAYLLQVLAVAVSGLLIKLALAALNHLWLCLPFAQASFLVSDYVLTFFCIGVSVFISQAIFGTLIRKVLVLDGKLWLKSLGYQSHVFALTDIRSLELIRPVTLFFSPGEMWKVKARHYFYDIQFWRQGVLVQLTHGKALYLGIRDPQKAVQELEELIGLAKTQSLIPTPLEQKAA